MNKTATRHKNIYKSVFSYLRTLITWHCPHSPAAAATIDRNILPAGPTTATCSSGFTRTTVGPCWDRQTDRRTDTVPFHRPRSAYYASSANKRRSAWRGLCMYSESGGTRCRKWFSAASYAESITDAVIRTSAAESASFHTTTLSLGIF